MPLDHRGITHEIVERNELMYLKAQLNNFKKMHAFPYGSNSNVIHAT
jgi:hypothetical protein